MNYIAKNFNSIEETESLIKCTSKTPKNEAKEQKGGLLGMLLGT